jgi:hypothetical protein
MTLIAHLSLLIATIKAAIGGLEGRVDMLETGSGGSTLKGQATVTIPLGYDATQTVAAAGVVPSMMILAGLAPVDDAAENNPDFLNPSYIVGVAGEDEINFQIGFDAKESGPVLINWSAI